LRPLRLCVKLFFARKDAKPAKKSQRRSKREIIALSIA